MCCVKLLFLGYQFDTLYLPNGNYFTVIIYAISVCCIVYSDEDREKYACLDGSDR